MVPIPSRVSCCDFPPLFSLNFSFEQSKKKEDCGVDLREDPTKGVIIANLTEVNVGDLRSTLKQLEVGSSKVKEALFNPSALFFAQSVQTYILPCFQFTSAVCVSYDLRDHFYPNATDRTYLIGF